MAPFRVASLADSLRCRCSAFDDGFQSLADGLHALDQGPECFALLTESGHGFGVPLVGHGHGFGMSFICRCYGLSVPLVVCGPALIGGPTHEPEPDPYQDDLPNPPSNPVPQVAKPKHRVPVVDSSKLEFRHGEFPSPCPTTMTLAHRLGDDVGVENDHRPHLTRRLHSEPTSRSPCKQDVATLPHVVHTAGRDPPCTNVTQEKGAVTCRRDFPGPVYRRRPASLLPPDMTIPFRLSTVWRSVLTPHAPRCLERDPTGSPSPDGFRYMTVR